MNLNIKIEAQKKMIEQLIQENMELKEQMLCYQIRIDELEQNESIAQNTQMTMGAAIQDVLNSKKQYESLINDIVQLKKQYETTYNTLEKLKRK